MKMKAMKLLVQTMHLQSRLIALKYLMSVIRLKIVPEPDHHTGYTSALQEL